MASLEITIDTSKLKQELGKISTQLKDFKEALELIGEEIEEVIDLAFQSESEPSGKRWKAWSDTTKAIHGTAGSILNRTGRLRRSIHVIKRNNEVIIEVRNPYAATHQFGNPRNKAFGRGSAPIPARKFLPIRTLSNLDSDMIARIEEILEEYFEVE